MDAGTLASLEVGKRLPAITLETPGRPASLRSSAQRRLATVVLVSHGGGCDACRDYARRLAAEVDWKDWDGRLVVLFPGTGKGEVYSPGGGARPTPIEGWEHGDASGGDGARLLIADRYGQIYHVDPIGADHPFPPPESVEEWLRFLTTQCPECGVIDQPWV